MAEIMAWPVGSGQIPVTAAARQSEQDVDGRLPADIGDMALRLPGERTTTATFSFAPVYEIDGRWP
jgi:hypothetical protein